MSHLVGNTWGHVRGYAPMIATATAYRAEVDDVTVEWEQRSLQAFADQPLDELAATFDLIVVDHPHVGEIAESGSILALDELLPVEALEQLDRQSVGPSHRSYEYAGYQWALAIDAAAQVSGHRPDLLPNPPRTWSQVVGLAVEGRVLWPLKPVDAISSFFTLAANRGTPCATRNDALIDVADGVAVLEAMEAVTRHVPRACLTMNPIEVADLLSSEDDHAYCPLLFGYSNYARDGFARHLVAYTDIPALGDDGCTGAILGGAGLAVSSRCSDAEAAAAYSLWVAQASTQRGLYFQSGGQPANAVAWDDNEVNRASHDFFRNTRQTMERSWLRPRYAGSLDLQDEGGHVVNAFLSDPSADKTAVVKRLNDLYGATR